MIKITESPREGMQGLSRLIGTGEKVRYINKLLRVGFDTVEIGSLVSPKLIPVMADSLEVLRKLDLAGTTSNRMFLAVSNKGADTLARVDEITHISYPFSFSPTFLKFNLNSTITQSIETAGNIVNLCEKNGKHAVIYISMAFGNPYSDPWNIDLLIEWADKLHREGAGIIMLSNVSIEIDAALIKTVCSALTSMLPDVAFGLHLHTSGTDWYDKVDAAYQAGFRRFDGVLNGLGGCPMTGKELLGNLKTENLIEYARRNRIPVSIDYPLLDEATIMANEVFINH